MSVQTWLQHPGIRDASKADGLWVAREKPANPALQLQDPGIAAVPVVYQGQPVSIVAERRLGHGDQPFWTWRRGASTDRIDWGLLLAEGSTLLWLTLALYLVTKPWASPVQVQVALPPAACYGCSEASAGMCTECERAFCPRHGGLSAKGIICKDCYERWRCHLLVCLVTWLPLTCFMVWVVLDELGPRSERKPLASWQPLAVLYGGLMLFGFWHALNDFRSIRARDPDSRQ